MKRKRQNFAALLGILAVMTLSAPAAQAALSTDLQNLNTQAQQLQNTMQAINLSADDLCAPLNQANGLARELVNSLTAVDASLAAPLQTDAAVYDALDTLFNTSLGIANEALRLSVDLQSLSSASQMITLKDGIASMLQLSSDIGSMADRIGAMADKILVMSDNIGLMADRILATQQLQNQNVALTTASILQTQTNVLSLVSVVEDSSYNLSFAQLITDGGLLAAQMQAVILNPLTMKTQLQSVATNVRSFLNEVQGVRDIVINDSSTNTIYISYDSMVQLGSMSMMLTSLATAVDGYVIAIDGLKAITSTPTLADSMGSMLQLSADIGVMSNRILEMADQILAMSDNIGLQADQILLTQAAMNTNVATTQTSILAAQEFAIGLIAARNL